MKISRLMFAVGLALTAPLASQAKLTEHGFEPDFSDERRHHEIYLSDPRRANPAKMRTVVRHPIRSV